MDLLLELADCTSNFGCVKDTRFISVSFKVTQTSLSITTYESKKIINLIKGKEEQEEGKRIDVYIVESEIENGIHGYFCEMLPLGIELNLFCSHQQMNELLNFVARGASPNEIEIELNDAKKSYGGFIMTKEDYEVKSWRFQISVQ